MTVEKAASQKVKKILVVDDEKIISRVVSDILRQEGFEVDVSFDGHQAITAFKKFRPHLVIMDVMMPKENGYRVARRIKTAYRAGRTIREPKIMLLTARDLSHDPARENAMHLFSLADAYMYKPFVVEELLEKVRTLLAVPN
jgi:two-component system alkaline phosphatase synthesis response regulator PhoP